MTAIFGWVGLVLMSSFMDKGGVKKQVKRNEQDMDRKLNIKNGGNRGRDNLCPHRYGGTAAAATTSLLARTRRAVPQ